MAYETTCADCGLATGHKWECRYNPYSHPSGNCPPLCGQHVVGKPATAEPPAWTESAMLKLWWTERGHKGNGPCETFGMTARSFRENDGFCNRAIPGGEGGPIYIKPDPIAEFNARRIAKRESSAPTESVHPWAAAGHTHAEWSTDACPKCLLTGQEVRERGYYPKCDDYKRERETSGSLARACRLDLHHTISDLIRPWRGK